MKNNTFKFVKIFICTIILILTLGFSAGAQTLEQRLENQNNVLNGSINAEEVLPDFYTEMYDEVNENSGNTSLDVGEMVMNVVKKFAIDGRDIVIAAYALYVLVALILLGVFGSRDLAKRKKGIYTLVGVSILFLFYINLPLILLYAQGDKSLTLQMSITERIYSVVGFLQDNSFIISALIGYVGITKLIVSKNDLSFILQGRYLVKFSFVLLILLNTIPFIIRVII